MLSDGTHCFYGNCDPKLNALFRNELAIGDVIRVDNFLIQDCDLRGKKFYLSGATKVSKEAQALCRPTKNIQPVVKLHWPVSCHCCDRYAKSDGLKRYSSCKGCSFIA